MPKKTAFIIDAFYELATDIACYADPGSSATPITSINVTPCAYMIFRMCADVCKDEAMPKEIKNTVAAGAMGFLSGLSIVPQSKTKTSALPDEPSYMDYLIAAETILNETWHRAAQPLGMTLAKTGLQELKDLLTPYSA